jgi:hypothetical protein
MGFLWARFLWILGGIIAGLSPSVELINCFILHLGLFLEVECKELDWSFLFLNVYGPYVDRVQFWNRIFASRVLKSDTLILVGDFNFTLNHVEIWGM